MELRSLGAIKAGYVEVGTKICLPDSILHFWKRKIIELSQFIE